MSLPPSFCANQGVAYIIVLWNNTSVTWNCVRDCSNFALWYWSAWRSVQNIWNMVSCKYFWLLWSIPTKLWASHGADQTAFGKNFESMLYSCLLNDFYFALRSILGGRSGETYDECWILSILAVLLLFFKFWAVHRVPNTWFAWNK